MDKQNLTGTKPKRNEKPPNSAEKKKTLSATMKEKLGITKSPNSKTMLGEQTLSELSPNKTKSGKKDSKGAAKALIPGSSASGSENVEESLMMAIREYYQSYNVTSSSKADMSFGDDNSAYDHTRGLEKFYFAHVSRKFIIKSAEDVIKVSFKSMSSKDFRERLPSPPGALEKKSRIKSPKQKLSKVTRSSERTYAKDESKFETLPQESNEAIQKSSSKGTKCKTPKKKIVKASRETLEQNVHPDAAFRIEKHTPDKQWIPVEFLKGMVSSPPRSLLESSPVYEYDPCNDCHEIKFPIDYNYREQSIKKEGYLGLRRRFNHNFSLVYVVLLDNKTMLIYKNKNDRNALAVPKFAYYLKDCAAKKCEVIFRVRVKDAVSSTALHFITALPNNRNDWIASIHELRDQLDTIEPKSIKSLEDKLLEAGMRNNDDSFKILRVIGRGTFGKVVICKHLVNERNYILKVMRKDGIAMQNGESAVLFEYKMLRNLSHRFLQKINYNFMNDNLIVFGMEYPNGRCLANYVMNAELHGEHVCVYYGLQLATAIIYLHSKNILHRALTIHNIYLDHEGNLKVADFGMSIDVMDNKRFNWHILQHPSYVAPELLNEEPYSITVDWWAYGVCCYVMITGKEPFIKRDEMEEETDIYRSVENEGIDTSYEEISDTGKNFFDRILNKNPKERLGCEGDELEILMHKIFAEQIYNEFNNIKNVPPFKPDVKDETDASMYYEEETLSENIQLTPPRNEDKYYLDVSKFLPEGFQNLIY